MDFMWSNIFRKRQESDPITLDLLKQVPLFADLTEKELREFVLISHLRSYHPGEVIFWEGEPGVGMYIIREGRVQISKKCEEKEKGTVLAELAVGDFFGELALLDDSPRSACATALEQTSLIGIFRPDLFDLFDRKPALGVKLLVKLANIVGQRLKATNQELRNLQRQLSGTQSE